MTCRQCHDGKKRDKDHTVWCRLYGDVFVADDSCPRFLEGAKPVTLPGPDLHIPPVGPVDDGGME